MIRSGSWCLNRECGGDRAQLPGARSWRRATTLWYIFGRSDSFRIDATNTEVSAIRPLQSIKRVQAADYGASSSADPLVRSPAK